MPSKLIYSAEVRHDGLNKYRIIKAETQYELTQKSNALMAQWNEQWVKRIDRENRINNTEDSLAYADEMTQQAEEVQNLLDTILTRSIHPKPVNMEDMKVFSKYSEPQPKKPTLESMPIMPRQSDEKYNIKPSFLVRIFKKKRMEFIRKNEDAFRIDLESWIEKQKAHQSINSDRMSKYKEALNQWENDMANHYHVQNQNNRRIDLLYEKYKAGNKEAVEWYFRVSLETIKLSIEYDKTIRVEYTAENKMLIVDISLPIIDDIPKLKKVNYIKTRNEFQETYHSVTYLKKKYDDVIYQIVLLTINYIFCLSSQNSSIDTIVLNGQVHTVDKTTGQEIEPYILSVNITRTDFLRINLNNVDPRAWFKSVKGVSAVTLAKVTPVAPIVMMNKEDKRFVEGYSISESIDDSVNLAAMDWQDFENLIREIFEWEFNTNGGEVKITQASRDGGVDAIAFDPDPIRGGKIVIQAKRYTNIVDVSAVRDLFGTVHNEGAIKGILVTTSNYGKDAYSFAQGKPLTLLNGANLLHLLEQHGYKARIDIREAKEIINAQKC